MTTIGPETRINGRIEGDSDVLVEGRVDGTIAIAAVLTVAPGGFVTGDVEADMIVIEGFASGTFRASQVVHLTSTAQVEGEIFANAVRLDPGARLRGRVEMDVAAAPPLPSRPERPAARPVPRTAKAATARREEPAAEPAAAAPAPVEVVAPPAEPAPAEPAPARARQEPPAPVARAVPAPRAVAQAVAAPQAKTVTLDVDPDTLTVKQLREMLTERGLALSGTKTELVRRLRTGE